MQLTAVCLPALNASPILKELRHRLGDQARHLTHRVALAKALESYLTSDSNSWILENLFMRFMLLRHGFRLISG